MANPRSNDWVMVQGPHDWPSRDEILERAVCPKSIFNNPQNFAQWLLDGIPDNAPEFADLLLEEEFRTAAANQGLPTD